MTPTSNSQKTPWVWRNALRLIFPLTLPWAPLFLFANDIYNAIPEGSTYHNLIEYLLVPVFLIISVLFSLLIYRIWPGFLRVPGKVPFFPFLLIQIILKPVLVYLVLTIITIFISLLLDPPPWKSDNPQYIPLIFFAVVFYPIVLTPVIALITIWRSILRKALETKE